MVNADKHHFCTFCLLVFLQLSCCWWVFNMDCICGVSLFYTANIQNDVQLMMWISLSELIVTAVIYYIFIRP